IRPEDREKIRQVIQDWNGKAEKSYVAKWIEKNGKKLFQNATDLEYAWNTLEDLGLRKKLLALKGNTADIGSLAWWMDKEPLRTRAHPGATEPKPMESDHDKRGKTAGELGIDTVAHETSGWDAYEAITNSPVGKPNLFISRNGRNGESAAQGEGFYTMKG